jgi:hypothetical protein
LVSYLSHHPPSLRYGVIDSLRYGVIDFAAAGQAKADATP